MTEDQVDYVVKIEAKEIKSVTGSVKGRIQEYVRNMHRFPSAEFTLHRREGWIKVTGVSESVLKEALDSARSALSPYHKFSYTIVPEETVEETGDDQSQSATVGEELNEKFLAWMKPAQKKWEAEAQAYQQEISRLQKEIEKLESEKKGLVELSARVRESLTSLQARYNEISSLYEQVSARSVQSPEEAAKIWVSDWTSAAYRIDEDIKSTGFAGKLKEIPELLNADMEWLQAAIRSRLLPGATAPQTVSEIEALANVNNWEDTELYKRLIEDYRRALDEIKYLDDLKHGRVPVPESLRETFIKAIDEEKDLAVISRYETAQREFKKKNAAASEISVLVQKFKTGEALRSLRARLAKEKPMPVLVLSEKDGTKWSLKLHLAASKGIVRESCLECVKKAAEDVGLRMQDEVSSENLVSIPCVLPGSVQSWKEASRIQDKLVMDLINAYKGCPLHVLGVNMKVTKVMDLVSSKERVEVKDSESDHSKIGATRDSIQPDGRC